MTWEHWVPRIAHPHRPFDEREASRVWHALRDLFPEAASVTLMPDHIHILLPSGDPVLARRRILVIMSAVSKRSGIPALWQRLGEPRPVNNAEHLRRTIRYNILNPCPRLVKDPLEWPWSTYREMLDLSTTPWPGPRHALRVIDPRSLEHFHRYITVDDRVDPRGTPPPRAATSPSRVPTHGVFEVAAAVCSLFRIPFEEIRSNTAARSYFCHLAETVGLSQRRHLSVALGVSPATLRRIFQRPKPGLEAGLRCLGDSRLTHYFLDLIEKSLKSKGPPPDVLHL